MAKTKYKISPVEVEGAVWYEPENLLVEEYDVDFDYCDMEGISNVIIRVKGDKSVDVEFMSTEDQFIEHVKTEMFKMAIPDIKKLGEALYDLVEEHEHTVAYEAGWLVNCSEWGDKEDIGGSNGQGVNEAIINRLTSRVRMLEHDLNRLKKGSEDD